MSKGARIILTGTTGMVGQGALKYALEDPSVEAVLSLSRRPTGLPPHPKLRELLVPDFYNLSNIAHELVGYDACLHCLGVSAAGLSEAAYSKITLDLTLELAQTYLAANPGGGFCYVSGQGTDSDGRQMWARVKGKTEKSLLAMPFGHVHVFRPGFIEPAPGVKSATGWYNTAYAVLRPLFPLFRRLPGIATTSQKIYRAMLKSALEGYSSPVLENRDINMYGAL
jgi:uncharacterized protein YbjT (DUF2867 family)